MLLKESEAVPEGNGPVPQQEKIGSGQPTLEDFRRALSEMRGDILGEFKEDLRCLNQRLAGLEHDARQPRSAMEADGPADNKTRGRTEGVATAVQVMHGDSCTSQSVQDGPKTLTCLGVMAEPPALPCREDVLVENGAAAPKSCFPPLEMCTTSAAGGLPPTGETSTATKITFNQPPLRLYSTEGKNVWTPTLSVSYASFFFWKNGLLAAPSCRRVIETKSGENRMFDPGGFQGRLRACAFLGSWRALFGGEVHVKVG